MRLFIHLYQHIQCGVDVPARTGGVPTEQEIESSITRKSIKWPGCVLLLSCFENVSTDLALELRLSLVQKQDDLLHDGPDVVAVDQGKRELQGPLLDRDIILLEAVQDSVPVSLDSTVVDMDCLQKGVQSYISMIMGKGMKQKMNTCI